MKNHLHRSLFLFILLALIVNGHAPQVNCFYDGFWPASSQSEYALPWEEEAESESETHFDILNSDGSDGGGGGDDETGLLKYSDNNSNSANDFSFHAWTFLPHSSQHFSFSKVQIQASSKELLTAPKPLLFLLYHNIKSDLAHLAA